MILNHRGALFCLLLLLIAASAKELPSHRIRREPSLRLTKRKLTRLKERYISKARQRSTSRIHEKVRQRGTVLSFGKPSRQQLTKWFGGNVGTASPQACITRRQYYNHDMVGMTNPSIAASTSQAANLSETVSVSRGVVQQEQEHNEWWPGTAIPESVLEQADWNICRVQQRNIGHGLSCYERIRDAALDWEFSTQRQGIAQVHPPEALRGIYSVRPVDNDDYISNHPFAATSESTQQIWQGPSKRLVTFVRSKFLPIVFAVNPVSVVYNVVDQDPFPAVDASWSPLTRTYTSTAFATLRGHWLQGEERLTVALRSDDSIDVEIMSIAKPKTTMGRLVWPFINGMKREFFRQQIQSLQKVGKDDANRH
ncbi:hypothetical protein MPSEU_000318600 [Mayamaea pseudoterrestris]|nr:hypothetical protein MPSEU_000318600 [Mayamaea pseudoterrestris]